MHMQLQRILYPSPIPNCTKKNIRDEQTSLSMHMPDADVAHVQPQSLLQSPRNLDRRWENTELTKQNDTTHRWYGISYAILDACAIAKPLAALSDPNCLVEEIHSWKPVKPPINGHPLRS